MGPGDRFKVGPGPFFGCVGFACQSLVSFFGFTSLVGTFIGVGCVSLVVVVVLVARFWCEWCLIWLVVLVCHRFD